MSLGDSIVLILSKNDKLKKKRSEKCQETYEFFSFPLVPLQKGKKFPLVFKFLSFEDLPMSGVAVALELPQNNVVKAI